MENVGRLDHRHVLRAIDARPADGYHMLVMEYVPGKSLAQVLQSWEGSIGRKLLN